MHGISATFSFVCNPLHFFTLAVQIMNCASLGLCPALKLLNIWPFPLESRCFSLKNWISVSSFMHHVFGTVSGSSCSSQQGHCETHLLYTLPTPLPVFPPPRRWRCPNPLGRYLTPCGCIHVIHPGSVLAASLSAEIYIHSAQIAAETNPAFICVNTRHFINSQIHTQVRVTK